MQNSKNNTSTLFVWSLALRPRILSDERYVAAVGVDLSQSAAIRGMRAAAPSLFDEECACALVCSSRAISEFSGALIKKVEAIASESDPFSPGAAFNLPESIRLAWSTPKPLPSSSDVLGEGFTAFSAHAEPREIHRHMGNLLHPHPKAGSVATELALDMERLAVSWFGREALVFAHSVGSINECAAPLRAGAERNALARATQSEGPLAASVARKPRAL